MGPLATNLPADVVNRPAAISGRRHVLVNAGRVPSVGYITASVARLYLFRDGTSDVEVRGGENFISLQIRKISLCQLESPTQFSRNVRRQNIFVRNRMALRGSARQLGALGPTRRCGPQHALSPSPAYCRDSNGSTTAPVIC